MSGTTVNHANRLNLAYPRCRLDRQHANVMVKGKSSSYSIVEHRVPELIPVLGSQPAGDMSHKPGGRLPLLSARPAVTLTTLKRFRCSVNRGTMGVNSLPRTVCSYVTRQRRGCDLNPGPSASESSTLTTRLPLTYNFLKYRHDFFYLVHSLCYIFYKYCEKVVNNFLSYPAHSQTRRQTAYVLCQM